MKRIVFAAFVFSITAQACSSSKETVSQGSVPANNGSTAGSSTPNNTSGSKSTTTQSSQPQKEIKFQKDNIRYAE